MRASGNNIDLQDKNPGRWFYHNTSPLVLLASNRCNWQQHRFNQSGNFALDKGEIDRK